MIIIDQYVDDIWKGNELHRNEMKILAQDCLSCTKRNIKNVSLTIGFVDSQTMTEYNAKYRNKNYDTNVLSFEYKDKIFDDTYKPGVIIFSFDKITEECKEYNQKFKDRLYILFVHGFLHLLGYQHDEEKEREEMERIETEVLAKYNIDPYLMGS